MSNNPRDMVLMMPPSLIFSLLLIYKEGRSRKSGGGSFLGDLDDGELCVRGEGRTISTASEVCMDKGIHKAQLLDHQITWISKNASQKE